MNTNRSIWKPLYWFMVSLLSLVLVASAQATDLTPGSGFEVGLRTGFGSASIAGDQSYLWEKSRTGFWGGAFTRYAVTDVVSFEMNLAYVQKGGKDELAVVDYEGVQIGTVETTLAVERIEAAPMVVITFPVQGRVRPLLLGGLTFAFGGSSKVEAEGYETEDFSEVTKSMNVGFVIGAGLSYQMKTARVFADIRYSRDFGDFHEADAFEWINQVMSLGVGVGFGI